MSMKYYNDVKRRYEQLIPDDYDLKVLSEIKRIKNENPKVDDDKLFDLVFDYYYDIVGVSSNRLTCLIHYYIETLHINP